MNRPRPTRLYAALPLLLVAACATESAPESRPAAVYLEKTAPEWIAEFRGPEQARREAAVAALEKLGPETCPLVAAELEDADADVRYSALETLARFGPEADGAAERVAARVADPDPKVRAHAAYVLLKLGENGAGPGVPRLVGALHDPDWYVRWRAVTALSAYGDRAYPEGYEALKAIEHLDREPRVRKDAALAAERIWAEYDRMKRSGSRDGRRRDDVSP
jgi:HEAT repeat protein